MVLAVVSASSCPTWVKPPATTASTISWALVASAVPFATLMGCSVLSYGAAGLVGLGVAEGVGVADGLGDGVALPSGSVRSTSFRSAANSCEAAGCAASSRLGSLVAGAGGIATNAALLTSTGL